MTSRSLFCAALLIFCPACESESGDDDATSSSDASDATSSDASGDASASASQDGGDGDGDASSGDGDGDGDASSTGGDGDATSTDGGDGDGDAALGEQLWIEGGHMERCGMCHGENGQYPPEALAGALTEAEIFNQIVNGGEVMTPQVPDELTLAEAAHIAAYLASLN